MTIDLLLEFVSWLLFYMAIAAPLLLLSFLILATWMLRRLREPIRSWVPTTQPSPLAPKLDVISKDAADCGLISIGRFRHADPALSNMQMQLWIDATGESLFLAVVGRQLRIDATHLVFLSRLDDGTYVATRDQFPPLTPPGLIRSKVYLKADVRELQQKHLRRLKAAKAPVNRITSADAHEQFGAIQDPRVQQLCTLRWARLTDDQAHWQYTPRGVVAFFFRVYLGNLVRYMLQMHRQSRFSPYGDARSPDRSAAIPSHDAE